MASWALGRSSSVDSRRAYTTHLGKTITGDLDRCRGPIRSPFSRKTYWPSGLGCCHQMFSAVISFGDAWATQGHLLSVVPFLQALSGTGMKGLVFPKDCKQKQISKMHWGWPRWSWYFLRARSRCHSRDPDTCSLYPSLRATSPGGQFGAVVLDWIDPLRDLWDRCDGSPP